MAVMPIKCLVYTHLYSYMYILKSMYRLSEYVQ